MVVVNDTGVRPATARDVPVLQELERACFPEPWADSSLADLAVDEGKIVLVAEVEGMVAGYAAGWVVGAEAEMARLAVLPSYRRRAIGTALLAAMVAALRTAGAELVILEVAATNAAARRIYEALGFRQIGTRRGYYRDCDGVVMRLDFGP